MTISFRIKTGKWYQKALGGSCISDFSIRKKDRLADGLSEITINGISLDSRLRSANARLWVISGHKRASERCPLYPRQRNAQRRGRTSKHEGAKFKNINACPQSVIGRRAHEDAPASSHSLPSRELRGRHETHAEDHRALALPEGKSEQIVFDDDLAGFGMRLRAGGSRA